MNRKTSAVFAFSWPVLVFVAALVLSCWLALPAHADDFDDHLAALKQQNAAAGKPHDHADPFAPKNAAYTHRYESDYGGRYVCDCGCIETGACVCKNCCSPAKTRRADERPAAKGAGGCHCKGDQCYHDCEGVCNDITCPFRPIIDAPAEEMIRASDGRTYPRSAWPNGDPWAGVRQTYYAPVGPADSSPRYHPLVAPRFFGGGAVSCGPSG